MRLSVCLSVLGQKNIFYDFVFSCSLLKKHSLSRDQRSKKHFLWFSFFALIVQKTWSGSWSKVQKTSYTSGFKGQKNIFHDFLLSRLLSKKQGPGQDRKREKHCLGGFKGLKNHCSLPGSKVKKKIIFFLNPYQKTWCASVQRLTVKIDQRIWRIQEFDSTEALFNIASFEVLARQRLFYWSYIFSDWEISQSSDFNSWFLWNWKSSCKQKKESGGW
jgi:hypothetical protein